MSGEQLPRAATSRHTAPAPKPRDSHGAAWIAASVGFLTAGILAGAALNGRTTGLLLPVAGFLGYLIAFRRGMLSWNADRIWRAPATFPEKRAGEASEGGDASVLYELATRHIANRLEPKRRGAVRGLAPEPVGARVMVAMSSNPETTRLLLSRAPSIAGGLSSDWFAVHVRTKKEGPQRISAREQRLLSENVTLAMELGAKVVWLAGDDVAGELLRFSREQGVTLAIFGKSRLSRFGRLLRKSPIESFTRLGTGVDVYEIETTA